MWIWRDTHILSIAPTVGIVYERKLSILSNKTRKGFSECQSFSASSRSYDLVEQRHFYIFLEAGYLLASSRYCLHVEWLLTRVGCSVVLVREKRRTFKWQSVRSSALCLLQSVFFFLSVASINIFGEGNGNPLQCSCLENSTEERGGLQSMGSQRVGHNSATSITINVLFPVRFFLRICVYRCQFRLLKQRVRLQRWDFRAISVWKQEYKRAAWAPSLSIFPETWVSLAFLQEGTTWSSDKSVASRAQSPFSVDSLPPAVGPEATIESLPLC